MRIVLFTAASKLIFNKTRKVIVLRLCIINNISRNIFMVCTINTEQDMFKFFNSNRNILIFIKLKKKKLYA